MKSLTRLVISFLTASTLVLTAIAGPEHLASKDKEVMAAPAPPPCDWSGFYVGIHAGGAWGSWTANDLDGWNFPNPSWDYDVAGFNGGGQAGYNFQFGQFVVGFEGDIGYMNLGLDHRAVQPNHTSGNDTSADNDSDFYGTARLRLGYSVNNKWLFFVSGGGIGLNDKFQVVDKCTTGACGGGALQDQKQSDFLFGWTIGGGVEYAFNCHWSMKLEYLYFGLEDNTVTELDATNSPFHFSTTNNDGNIVRLGLNFKF
jgi:outer membrane immunogenic protein